MPLYQVEHIIPLPLSQRDRLAASITHLHSRTFTTPSLFVNIDFIDASNRSMYLGGKPQKFNRILASVRAGGGRSTRAFNDICTSLTRAWDDIINGGQKGDGDRELRGVFVFGSIEAALEAGFVVPQAGEDVAWLKTNYGEFKRRAEEGHEDFRGLMRELEEREDLKSKL